MKEIMKKCFVSLLVLVLIVPLIGCSSKKVIYGQQSIDGIVSISLGQNIYIEGSGVVVDDGRIAITDAGSYSIKGTLSDGQIIVNAGEDDKITLIFNGINVASSKSSPVYIRKAKDVVIILADGTSNIVKDPVKYSNDSETDEPNAAIFSKTDLTIKGNGSLTVSANYKNGIVGKDKLIIEGGNITVQSVADGIKGRDCIIVRAGTITIDAKGDGLQSTNDEDSEKGYISVQGGTINITSVLDGIQAETDVLISGGTVDIVSGGGSSISTKVRREGNFIPGRTAAANQNTSSAAVSTKGIKAAVDIAINGGSITIDSADDAINSNNSTAINGGNIILASGDDALHADVKIDINGGTLNISKCYEGIESKVLTINNGTIYIVSSDDGVNIGGSDTGVMGGRMGASPGQTSTAGTAASSLIINGGYLVVDAGGDGIDVNGSITMTNGFVIVNGPVNDGNGALDHSGFKMTGGFLVAAGSSGMAQAPDTSSTQYSIMMNFPSKQTANTLVYIETENGTPVLSFMPNKVYQSVVVCSPELKKGTTYNVYSGGSASGTVKDGLYTGGIYTAGIKIAGLTIANLVTSYGFAARGGFAGMPMR